MSFGHADPPLETVESRVNAAIVDVGTRQQHPRAHQLQMQPRGCCASHVGEAGGDHLRRPGQLARTQRRLPAS